MWLEGALLLVLWLLVSTRLVQHPSKTLSWWQHIHSRH